MNSSIGKIIDVMRKEGAANNPPSVLLGEVISIPPKLVVKVAGTQIDNEDILIADYLLNDYERRYKTSEIATEQWGNDRRVKLTDSLKIGDILAVMPTLDRQTFIVLCKVVKI